MEKRRQLILKEVEEKGEVRVAFLSQKYNCSEVTIRNDIRVLEQEGALKRVHGGAIALEKTHIRKYSAESAIVTNSLLAGNELAGLDHVDLYMIGGHVGGHLAATMGDDALENMKHFQVDKAFIGVHSINFDVGITSIATPQMQVKRAILNMSHKVYVLADSSKFGGGYLSVICPMKDIYKIITDDSISTENIKKAQKENISLVIAR